MRIHDKSDFINAIQDFDITSEYVIVKPNWLSNGDGEYTEPEILKWLFEALPNNKKIVVESYTPWRGLIYEPKGEDDELRVDLDGGKAYWDFYRELDQEFLSETGIGEVLEAFNAEYVNITEEVWSKRCVAPDTIRREIGKTGYEFTHEDFYSYLPTRLYEIRDRATLVSLAKLKLQAAESVGISFSIKNLYGMIPHPSRAVFHDIDNDFAGMSESMADIFLLYYVLFRSTLWINEGIITLVKEHFGEDQYVERGRNLLFVGRDPLQADAEASAEFDFDPYKSDYYRYLERHIKTSAAIIKPG